MRWEEALALRWKGLDHDLGPEWHTAIAGCFWWWLSWRWAAWAAGKMKGKGELRRKRHFLEGSLNYAVWGNETSSKSLVIWDILWSFETFFGLVVASYRGNIVMLNSPIIWIYRSQILVLIVCEMFDFTQGIVGCTPGPNVPRHGKSLYEPYIHLYTWYLLVSYPQEFQGWTQFSYHGSTRTWTGFSPLPLSLELYQDHSTSWCFFYVGNGWYSLSFRGAFFAKTVHPGTKMWNIMSSTSRWWFQIFFIFIPTWGNDPIWLIFFKWVETTR